MVKLEKIWTSFYGIRLKAQAIILYELPYIFKTGLQMKSLGAVALIRWQSSLPSSGAS
jgi:hypothetical protein